MSAKRSVVVGGFVVTNQEVRNNGFLSVASNRLKGLGGDPTEQQIQAFAENLRNKFPEFRKPAVPSISRF